MSRWRCQCGYIVDNRINYDYPKCPECEQSTPDESWIYLDHEESERLYKEQRMKINDDFYIISIKYVQDFFTFLKEKAKYDKGQVGRKLFNSQRRFRDGTRIY